MVLLLFTFSIHTATTLLQAPFYQDYRNCFLKDFPVSCLGLSKLSFLVELEYPSKAQLYYITFLLKASLPLSLALGIKLAEQCSLRGSPRFHPACPPASSLHHPVQYMLPRLSLFQLFKTVFSLTVLAFSQMLPLPITGYPALLSPTHLLKYF